MEKWKIISSTISIAWVLKTATGPIGSIKFYDPVTHMLILLTMNYSVVISKFAMESCGLVE